ncbi:unnamed protein product [Withania somnifera]
MAFSNTNVEDETSELLSAQAHIANHGFNYVSSMSLKCAVELGLPDIIHSHGRAMTLFDLVNALPINKAKGHNCIHRLMRILIHAGFFIQTKSNEQIEEGGYLLTPTSRLLLKDEPLSLATFVQGQLDPTLVDPWHSLGEWFKNGDSTPFATAHGKPLFEYAGGEPRLNHLFNEAMASDARLVMSVLNKNGNGYYMTVATKTLLRKCKEAIPSKENGGKVIVIDIVVDNQKGDDKSFETQLFSDVLMMVHVSEKERNQQEWAKLFSDAGFNDNKISPILGLRSVIEVYP